MDPWIVYLIKSTLSASVISWGFLCAVDGCVVASSLTCKCNNFNRYRWALFIGLGHFIMANIGVCLTSLTAYGFDSCNTQLVGKKLASIGAIAVVGFILSIFAKEFCSHGEPEAPDYKPTIGVWGQFTMALLLSLDALVQGCAVEAQCLNDGELFVILRAVLRTGVICGIVAAISFAGCCGVLLADRFGKKAGRIIQWFAFPALCYILHCSFFDLFSKS